MLANLLKTIRLKEATKTCIILLNYTFDYKKIARSETNFERTKTLCDINFALKAKQKTN